MRAIVAHYQPEPMRRAVIQIFPRNLQDPASICHTEFSAQFRSLVDSTVELCCNKDMNEEEDRDFSPDPPFRWSVGQNDVDAENGVEEDGSDVTDIELLSPEPRLSEMPPECVNTPSTPLNDPDQQDLIFCIDLHNTDFSNNSLFKMTALVIKSLREQALGPRIYTCLVVNAPWVFHYLFWPILKATLPAIRSSQLRFVSPTSAQEILVKAANVNVRYLLRDFGGVAGAFDVNYYPNVCSCPTR